MARKRSHDIQDARVDLKLAGIDLQAGKITLHDFLVRVNKGADKLYTAGFLDGRESNLVTEGK